jgi:predicted nucleotidyltransferase
MRTSMRFHAPLDDILSSRIKVRILRLFSRTRGSYSGREVARLIGFSHNPTIQALKELEAQGLLKRRSIGASHEYTLNEDHLLLSGVLLDVFERERDALLEIASIFEEKIGRNFEEAVIFGSVARGEERLDSDVDILIIIKDGVDKEDVENRVSEATSLAMAASGNPISPVLVTRSEYEKRKKAKSKRGMWRDLFDRRNTIIYTKEDIRAYGRQDTEKRRR